MTRIEVAAAVILDKDRRRVLVSRRRPDAHQGGKWEFPGGKCAPGESFIEALRRELEEELGIVPTHCRPFLSLVYPYPEKTVVLSVWTVSAYAGTPAGREGQAVQWVEINALDPHLFPPANRMIIQALTLPERCLVTPEAGLYEPAVFLQRIESFLQAGPAVVQLRSHKLDRTGYLALAESAGDLCQRYGGYLLLNMPPEWWRDGIAQGLHLTAWRLKQLTRRPDIRGWLSASCHDEAELAKAQHLGVDFAFVSPVKATTSHPEGRPLGWRGLERILNVAHVPVYALGGMQASDLTQAKYLGAYGIAAISAFWEQDS
ncbi:MAG TPA: Nudix family hydrolase [Gammaproteobacteria bacterium]|nr:Nudix family hydrolase [Gammaproteobacteria bacterium]